MNFNSSFSIDEFKKFSRNFLPDDFDLSHESISLPGRFSFITQVDKLGDCPSLDLKVYVIKHKGQNDPRVSLSKESFKILDKYKVSRALIAFISENSDNYRISLVTFQTKWESGRRVEKEFSNPRRYSFFLGPDAKVKTPENYLSEQVKNDEDLLSRFSIEVVNKEFYQQIAIFFSRLIGGERKIGSKNKHFNPEMILPSDNSDNKNYQEFAVRLIGRIIFCWFLKQKKSQANISLLPDEFLSSYAVKNSNDYYHSTLEPIFFEVLNKPRETRKPQFRNGYDRIPYLNGGLFDPHVDDYYENQPNEGLKISEDWLKDLFETLETYNFTIDENTTLDVDLSIDPEMLGRIFENLLAEINPETGESVRKSTGSYYTPRQIVEYMVDQSLIQYLTSQSNIEKQKIDALVSIDMEDDELNPLSDEEKQKVITALNEVKIIDPACGSGAFPIGILQKIVWILSKVDPLGKLWFDKKTENLDHLLKEKLAKEFSIKNFDYIRKIGIIKDSIFGVDILPIAVEVSKLRCFLTLVVDESIDDNQENRGIEPLPNLEFKFVSANTLIRLPGSLSSNNGQTTMFEEDNEIDQLRKVRDRYFTSTGIEKDRVKMDFYRVQKTMFDKQISQGRSGIGQLTMALARWDPFKDTPSDWFDPEWMFGVKLFDIVIANPPYGLINKKQNKHTSVIISDELFKKLREDYPDACGGMINIFRFFVVNNIALLKDDGCFCEIFPLSFTGDQSIKKLRESIFCNNTIISIEAFPERDDANKRVFQAVKMSVCIMTLLKKKNQDNFSVRINHDRFVDEGTKPLNLTYADIVLFDPENFSIPLLNSTEIDLLKRIYKSSVRFNTFSHCFDGEVHITKHKKCITNNSEDSPLIKGAIVDRYRIRKNMSQGIIQYLNKESFLSSNSGGKAQHHKTPRIVMQRITGINEKTRIKATIIDRDVYCANSIGYLILNDNSHDIRLVLAVLNSSISNFVFKLFSTNSNVNGYEIGNLPFPLFGNGLNDKIATLVNKIIELKKSKGAEEKEAELETREYQEQINQIIYEFYGLKPEDIKIIKSVNKPHV